MSNVQRPKSVRLWTLDIGLLTLNLAARTANQQTEQEAGRRRDQEGLPRILARVSFRVFSHLLVVHVLQVFDLIGRHRDLVAHVVLRLRGGLGDLLSVLLRGRGDTFTRGR